MKTAFTLAMTKIARGKTWHCSFRECVHLLHRRLPLQEPCQSGDAAKLPTEHVDPTVKPTGSGRTESPACSENGNERSHEFDSVSKGRHPAFEENLSS